MIRKALMVALPALPMPVSAEPVIVRSGEHPGFSRLVLDFEERPPWSLQVMDGQVRILLPAGAWSFETGAIFQRIPRTRITGVTGRADGLELSLGCDCSVAAFEVHSAAIAVDIADAAPEDFVSALDHTSSGGSATPNAVSRVEDDPLSEPPVPPGFVDNAAPHGFAPRDFDAPRRMAMTPMHVPSGRETNPPREAFHPHDDHRALADLTEGIARAATSGVLTLAPNAAGAHARFGPAAVGAAETANIRLRLPGEETRMPPDVPEGSGCRGSAAYDVASWRQDGRTPAEAIGVLRSAIATDVDTIDEVRAIDLARLYISLGFGAEARAVVEALAPRHPEAELLITMAKILDGDLPAPGAFDAEADCPGRAQLWTALASGRPADAEAVEVAVSELPLELRRHVGPRLITAFHASGDAPTAEAIRAAVARAAGPHGAPFDLVAAKLDTERETARGMAKIRDLASGPSPSSDQALVALLEMAREQGRAVDAGSIIQAEARADDLRGTEEGARLERGVVYALLQRDEFGRATSRLARMANASDLPEEILDALAEALLTALADRGTDEAVLVHSAALQGAISDLVRNGSAGLATANRLIEMGLPQLASSYLPEVLSAPDAALATARQRLLSGDPAGALAILDAIDVPGTGHLAVRSEALRSLGRLEEAAATRSALAEAGVQETGKPIVEQEGSEPASGPTNAVAGPGTPEPDQDRGESPSELVIASEEARREIEALLGALPRP